MECLDDVMLARLLSPCADPPVGFDQHLDGCAACRVLVGEALRRLGSQPSAPPRSPLEPGHRVGRYVLLGRLGEGAAGVVYSAHDPELDRRVAIKLVARSLDPARNARLLEEARAMAKLADPHVVRVLDAGTQGESVFVAMELMTGGTLRAWQREARTWADVLDRYLEAGRGLAAAHRIGLVHRDFKPDNVLVGDDGRARVADFGLAGHAATDEPSGSQGTTGVGTPRYMSPEAHAGKRIDERSDQYSFCAALFEGLYRRPAFADADTDALATAKASDRLVEPPRVGPRVLLRVLRRGLQADPAARFGAMDELLAALERVRSRRRRLVSAAGTALAVGVGAGAAALARTPIEHDCPDPRQELVGIWDEDVAAEIAEVARTVDRPAATTVVERASLRLDAYASEWVEARLANCHARAAATVSEGIADARDGCLALRLTGLQALSGELRSLDPPMVERVSRAAWSLPPIRACDDGSEHVGDRLQALQELEHARALMRLGRHDPAEAGMLDVLEAAEATGDRWLAAEARLDYCASLRLRTERSDAREACEAAALDAVRSGNDRAAAGAWNLLYSLSLGDETELELNEHYERLASAAIDAIDDPNLRGAFEHHRGSALLPKTPPQALQHFEASVQYYVEGCGGFDHPLVAEELIQVALAKSTMRRRDEAFEIVRQARGIVFATVGEDSPLGARAWEIEGLTLQEKDPRASFAAKERSVVITERLYGADSANALKARASLAAFRWHLRPEERGLALTELDAALAGLRAKGIDHDQPLPALYSTRVMMLREAGRIDEAVAACDAALEVVRRIDGERSYSMSQARSQCGSTYRVAGDLQRALAEHRASLEIAEGTLGADDPRYATEAESIAAIQAELEMRNARRLHE